MYFKGWIQVDQCAIDTQKQGLQGEAAPAAHN